MEKTIINMSNWELYFPKGWGNCMETYVWSDNIKQAVIKNIYDFTIEFNRQEIAPGETKEFTRKERAESPDTENY